MASLGGQLRRGGNNKGRNKACLLLFTAFNKLPLMSYLVGPTDGRIACGPFSWFVYSASDASVSARSVRPRVAPRVASR